MNILFFEFEPEYADSLTAIFNVRDYYMAYAFVNEENQSKLAEFSDSISAKISAIVIKDTDQSELIIEKTIIEELKKPKTYSAFFTICRTQKPLEKIALRLSTTAKIKACFVCLEDRTSSVFDLPDAQFIRMCFDTDNYSEMSDTHVSTNIKIIPHLVGKFSFLEKVLNNNHD